MRTWLLLSFCALLAACAGPRELVQPPEHLFDDSLFAAPAEAVGAADIFAVSDAMRRYLQHPQIVAQLRRKGPHRGLLEALYTTGELRLDYDASTTRNAAQAFDARAGNCLSLVVMTAAFAKELGLTVRYQSAYLEETVSRSGNLVLRSGHVNVTLGRRFADPRLQDREPMTVDFLPPEELRSLRTREIDEDTVVAMYLNNRAVETAGAANFTTSYDDQNYLLLGSNRRTDAILLDTFVEGSPGGTGKTFSWEVAREAKRFGRVILAGGLNCENVRSAIETVQPYAVDVSSGVETAPGRKDRVRLAEFLKKAKECLL